MAPSTKENNEEVSHGLAVHPEDYERSKHKDLLPTYEAKVLSPLKFFEHHDRGKFADKTFPNLFPKDGTYVAKKITPKLGTEIDGIQLSQLNDAGKDELALFVAQRGLAVFRNQDMAEKGPQFLTDFGSYFGPLHVHPVGPTPKGYPGLLLIYASKHSPGKAVRPLDTNTSSIAWHTDISYELQPPGITFFSVLEGPEAGGDTGFADTVEAYNRLSPEFQKFIDGLYVEQSSLEQAQSFSKDGGRPNRAGVKNIHPLVRVHPVTGDKMIYANPAFSRSIVGFKRQESDALLEFLYNHIANGHDFQARASYEPGTFVIWDNRRVQHTAINDWEDLDATRHAVRITPQAERPVADLKDLNKPDENRVVEDF